jgi:glycosyl hydrolase family 12
MRKPQLPWALSARQTQAAAPTSCSENWCTLPLGDTLYVLNNQWGAPTAEGWQTISVQSPTAWRVEFSWERAEDWQVTSYPAAILGWHWGEKIPSALTGLPLPIDSQALVVGEVVATMTPPNSPECRYNIAYDCWAHATPSPADGDDRFELMIWQAFSQDYLGHGAPYLEARPVLGGQRWKVLPGAIGHNATNQYDMVAFLVDGPNLTSTELDVMEFLRWIVDNRPLFPASTIYDALDSWYLTGVEFGSEIYKGTGALDVTRYVVTVDAGETPIPPDPEELTPEMRATLAVQALGEATKSGNEDPELGVARAYALVDTVWRNREAST